MLPCLRGTPGRQRQREDRVPPLGRRQVGDEGHPAAVARVVRVEVQAEAEEAPPGAAVLRQEPPGAVLIITIITILTIMTIMIIISIIIIIIVVIIIITIITMITMITTISLL